jgi:hypothetical protein
MDRAPINAPALDRARTGLLLANLFLAVLLTISGLLLLALYQPGSVLSALHRQAGRALLVTATLSLLLHLVPRPRPATAAAAAGLLTAGAAGLASGQLVAWRELAVWAVAVEAGRSFPGYLWLLGDDIRSVLVDRTALAPSTVAVLLVVHLGAGMLTGLVALAVAATTHGTHGVDRRDTSHTRS